MPAYVRFLTTSPRTPSPRCGTTLEARGQALRRGDGADDIERCMLMARIRGSRCLIPTCGGATTAFVA